MIIVVEVERERVVIVIYVRGCDGMVWKGVILLGNVENVCLFIVIVSLINFLFNF